MTPDTPPARTLPRWLVVLLSIFIAASLPVVLVLTGVRVVATDAFLQIEYNRPGFPQDRYGFTKQDRLTYAPYAVRYLLNDAGIAYLGNLTFADGSPLFHPDELRHMEDVKVVTRAALHIHIIASLGLLVAVSLLAWRRNTRDALRRALFTGGVFTISMILTLVVLIFANWSFFFDNFHNIFFESGTWQFSYSDTLIRLFPQQFWFDAAMTIGFFTVIGALVASGGVWAWERRQVRRSRPTEDGEPGSEITPFKDGSGAV